jgi:hypothetical protein
MTDLRDRAISKAYSIYRSYPGAAGVRRTDRLALLFFLLELYKRTKDASVSEKLLGELSLLEKDLVERRKGTYTLLQGSFGIAFLYLELFKFAGNDAYLNRANGIVLEYYQSESFKCGFIDDHSLFGGIAGILLVSVELYLRTNDPWLLQQIEKLLLKLIKTSHEGNVGIYWGGVTDNRKRNIGLATGAVGVAIPLTILGNVFGHKLMTELSRRAVEYEEAVRLGDNAVVAQDREAVKAALKKSSLCYGITGLMVAKLYQGSGPIDGSLLSFVQDALAGHHSIFGERAEDDSFGLFSGISGIGLAFKEAYRFSGDEKYWKEAESIGERILGTAGEASGDRAFPAVEQLGIGYFLLKLIEDYGDNSALLPDPRIKYSASTEHLPFDSIFKPGSPVMFETLIRKDFNRTFQILNAYIPAGLDHFLRQKTDSYYDDFVRYVETILSEEQDFSKRENLLLNFESERFGLSIRNGMHDCIPDDDDTILRIDRLLRLGKADFLSLRLAHSDKFRGYCGEKAVNVGDRFTKETFPMFMTQYGLRTFIYGVNDLDVLEQSSLGIYKLMFDQFGSPTSIHEAHGRLVGFLMRQNSDVLDIIRQQFITRYDQGIEQLVSELVLDGIRYCMMTGLLVVSD